KFDGPMGPRRAGVIGGGDPDRHATPMSNPCFSTDPPAHLESRQRGGPSPGTRRTRILRRGAAHRASIRNRNYEEVRALLEPLRHPWGLVTFVLLLVLVL